MLRSQGYHNVDIVHGVTASDSVDSVLRSGFILLKNVLFFWRYQHGAKLSLAHGINALIKLNHFPFYIIANCFITFSASKTFPLCASYSLHFYALAINVLSFL